MDGGAAKFDVTKTAGRMIELGRQTMKAWSVRMHGMLQGSWTRPQGALCNYGSTTVATLTSGQWSSDPEYLSDGHTAWVVRPGWQLPGFSLDEQRSPGG
jgi:hypothetical protein